MDRCALDNYLSYNVIASRQAVTPPPPPFSLSFAGGNMDVVDAEMPVAIMAENKSHAIGIGLTTMSTEDIAETNSGIGLELITALDDGLWNNPETTF